MKHDIPTTLLQTDKQTDRQIACTVPNIRTLRGVAGNNIKITTLWGKKLHPFIIAITLPVSTMLRFSLACIIGLMHSSLYFRNFWHTDTEVNLQQNCNRIAHLCWWVFLPYLVKYNRAYVILLRTAAHRWCLSSVAVSDKRILEWMSVSRSLQDRGLVFWEPLVWCEVRSLVSQQLGAIAHAWCAGKWKLPAGWQMSGSNCLSSKTSQ